jgi:hypothetical protein
MLMTPDAWGPTGKIIAGIGVPFSLGKAKTFLTAWTRGQGLPLVGGFTEPFTAAGQQRLAARYWAAIPGVEGNERLIVSLLNDVKNIPKRAGQSELVTTPAYFGKVSDDLLAAERDWLALRERGVSDADAIAQLSQNPTYGRYFTERFPVFKDQPPSLKVLEETRTKLKLVSDNLYGAMSWLASGSPIKNEVLRASGERLRVAEQIFKDLSRNFEGDPGAASAYVQKALEKLDELADEALATHATDALLYNRLKKLVEDPLSCTRLLAKGAFCQTRLWTIWLRQQELPRKHLPPSGLRELTLRHYGRGNGNWGPRPIYPGTSSQPDKGWRNWRQKELIRLLLHYPTLEKLLGSSRTLLPQSGFVFWKQKRPPTPRFRMSIRT